MHQLTDLSCAAGTALYEADLDRNVRLPVEGTRNLIAVAKAS